MTVILAAHLPFAKVLLSDVFVSNGDPYDSNAYNIAEKTFAFGDDENCIAVRGDEAFALILGGKAKFPDLDLRLRNRNPRSLDFKEEIAARATSYRQSSNHWCLKNGRASTGWMGTRLYVASRDELVYWDFEVVDHSYLCGQKSSCAVASGLMLVDCGGSVQRHPTENVPKPLIDLIPKLECEALPYAIRTGVTGVMLPSDRRAPVTWRKRSDLSNADLQIQIKPLQR
jgi:hypothetical protein